MSSLPKRHSKLKRSTDIFLKAGLPLVLFIIAGSYGLSVFMRTHYEYKDKKDKSITVRNFDLEEEHRKTMEKVISLIKPVINIFRMGNQTKIVIPVEYQGVYTLSHSSTWWRDFWIEFAW
jgi:hypothetical protein